jgi:hypothetical protein
MESVEINKRCSLHGLHASTIKKCVNPLRNDLFLNLNMERLFENPAG